MTLIMAFKIRLRKVKCQKCNADFNFFFQGFTIFQDNPINDENAPPVSGTSKQIIVNNENAPPAVAGGSKSHQQPSKTVWPPPPPASMLPRHPLASSSPADHLPARQGFGARSALTSGSSQNVSFTVSQS